MLAADRVVLPGDGAFPACRRQLMDHSGLFEAIDEAVTRRGRPFLGICIGMQMLATRGLEYQPIPGFGWIGGEVVQIDAAGLKVPHMGWNDLVIDRPHPLLDGIGTGQHAYFVHSYQFRVADPAHLLAHVDYGGPVTAIIGRDNLVGRAVPPGKEPGRRPAADRQFPELAALRGDGRSRAPCGAVGRPCRAEALRGALPPGCASPRDIWEAKIGQGGPRRWRGYFTRVQFCFLQIGPMQPATRSLSPERVIFEL